MKQSICLLLIICLVLLVLPLNTFAVNKAVTEFPDICNEYYAEAATHLKRMGILNGKGDGTFSGESHITRSEMAVIVCKILKKTDSDVNAEKNNLIFNDVAANHWALGYINIAAKAGIVNGDNYGFRPDDNVLYEEAIKMLVCTLGYDNEVIKDSSDWAKGYIDIAQKRGITLGLAGIKGEPVTRGDVALMTDNALNSKDSDGDGYNDFEDLNPTQKFMPPVILLHGFDSDSETAFGVKTNISGLNYLYFNPADDFLEEANYADPLKQSITNIEPQKLGSYLTDNMNYKQNINLFAFNYPCYDVVQFNAARLSAYTENLITLMSQSTVINEYKYFFPTEYAKNNKATQFILVGHSMGGLVSRYYIENIKSDYVVKLITINTPHYGSGYAQLSALTGVKYSPAVAELHPDSTLFGGNKVATSLFSTNASEYIEKNHSPALAGNKNVLTKYYAIAGYDATVYGMTLSNEELLDSIFAFKVLRDTSSEEAFKNSINQSLNEYSNGSSLLLPNGSGDKLVNYMSQLCVDFMGETVRFQELDGACMIVNTKRIPDMLHSYINGLSEMHGFLKEFIVN